MFDDPTLDFSFDSYMPFDPLNSNTKPDNFRQCVQNFSISTQESPGRPHWDASISPDTDATGSFLSRSQSFESANNASDMLIPHSSQITSDHEGLRRCDLSHTQSDSSLTSRSRMASAGQVDAHGIQVAANASSNSSEMGVVWHSGSLQVDSDNAGGSPGQGAPHTYHDGQADSPLLTGGDPLGDTALHRLGRPAATALRSAAGTSPQSNLRRHRTRSDGVYDPALQSELSSISATASSRSSSTEHTATLEGRPTWLGGTPVSPQLSSRGSVNSQTESATTMPPPRATTAQEARSSLLTTGRSPLSNTSTMTSLPAASTAAQRTARTSTSALQSQARAQSALLARPSQFDRIDGTHARATELFRLKHRIPASLDTTANATGFVPSVADLSAQANGGAYPRLRSNPTTGSSSSSSIATQQQPRTTQTVPSTTDKSSATEANGARMLFTESDTKRYRDHHGRTVSRNGPASAAIPSVAYIDSAARVAMVVLALGAMLLISMSTSIFAHPSFPLLAILTPFFVACTDWTTAALPSSGSRALRAVLGAKREQALSRCSVGAVRWGVCS
jgi:hypothetical protein